MPAEVRRRRDELVRRTHQAKDAADVFAQASTRLRGLVPYDSAGWVATDPGTGLPASPSRIDGMNFGADICLAYWYGELLVDDVNSFRQLARAEMPAASLRATLADPRQSTRYRRFLHPHGIDDELRVVLRVGEDPWATVNLFRQRGEPPFSRQETELLASLSAPLGEALRLRAKPVDGVEPAGGRVRPHRPGLLVFDAPSKRLCLGALSGAAVAADELPRRTPACEPLGALLVSANEEAEAWLAELSPEVTHPSDLGIDLPTWILGTVFRASIAADGIASDGIGVDGIGDGTARVRARTRRGQWLVCHASPLYDGSGRNGSIAVVIESAKAADIAPIVVQAYDLSDREQQITRMIARGNSTAEIADELFLSTHTIRDYVKTIFHKVDVSSRGELVAKLFAEHYLDVHTSGEIIHVADD